MAWTLGMLPSTLLSTGSGTQSSAPTEPSNAVVYGLAALMGLVAGAILGTPQWLVLRRHVRRAALWIPANALAWAPGMVMAFVAVDLLFAIGIGISAVVLAIAALAAIGAVVGAIHGLVLIWLVQGDRQEDEAEPGVGLGLQRARDPGCRRSALSSLRHNAQARVVGALDVALLDHRGRERRAPEGGRGRPGSTPLISQS